MKASIHRCGHREARTRFDHRVRALVVSTFVLGDHLFNHTFGASCGDSSKSQLEYCVCVPRRIIFHPSARAHQLVPSSSCVELLESKYFSERCILSTRDANAYLCTSTGTRTGTIVASQTTIKFPDGVGTTKARKSFDIFR